MTGRLISKYICPCLHQDLCLRRSIRLGNTPKRYPVCQPSDRLLGLGQLLVPGTRCSGRHQSWLRGAWRSANPCVGWLIPTKNVTRFCGAPVPARHWTSLLVLRRPGILHVSQYKQQLIHRVSQAEGTFGPWKNFCRPDPTASTKWVPGFVLTSQVCRTMVSHALSRRRILQIPTLHPDPSNQKQNLVA